MLLVHGIARSKDSFASLQPVLHSAGYATTAINYPSTRRGIGEHAKQLEELLNALEDIDTVSFVTHSMGGLVVRETLQHQGA